MNQQMLITIDQATARLGVAPDSRLHWSLGIAIAKIWDDAGNQPLYEVRPKTDANASVPAGHFKRVYPEGFVMQHVLRMVEDQRRQFDMFRNTIE